MNLYSAVWNKDRQTDRAIKKQTDRQTETSFMCSNIMADTHAFRILDKPLVCFFFVKVVQVALSVCEHSVEVRLVLHG